MQIKLYHEYRLKFYLNARHYIIINGNRGDTHPHTWEFAINIQFARSSFVEFNTFEEGIKDFLEKYQNKVLNDEEPFITILPTLENMTDYFAKEFFQIIYEIGGTLIRIEASETPTRSYIVNLLSEEEKDMLWEQSEKQEWSKVIDSVIDDIIQ